MLRKRIKYHSNNPDPFSPRGQKSPLNNQKEPFINSVIKTQQRVLISKPRDHSTRFKIIKKNEKGSKSNYSNDSRPPARKSDNIFNLEDNKRSETMTRLSIKMNKYLQRPPARQKSPLDEAGLEFSNTKNQFFDLNPNNQFFKEFKVYFNKNPRIDILKKNYWNSKYKTRNVTDRESVDMFKNSSNSLIPVTKTKPYVFQEKSEGDTLFYNKKDVLERSGLKSRKKFQSLQRIRKIPEITDL